EQADGEKPRLAPGVAAPELRAGAPEPLQQVAPSAVLQVFVGLAFAVLGLQLVLRMLRVLCLLLRLLLQLLVAQALVFVCDLLLCGFCPGVLGGGTSFLCRLVLCALFVCTLTHGRASSSFRSVQHRASSNQAIRFPRRMAGNGTRMRTDPRTDG